MRSILFSIPLDGSVDLGPLGKFPVFGIGLLLALWCLIGITYVTLTVRRHGWKGLARQPAHLGGGGPRHLQGRRIAHQVAARVWLWDDALSGFPGVVVAGGLAAAPRRTRRRDRLGCGHVDFHFRDPRRARLFYIIQYHGSLSPPIP